MPCSLAEVPPFHKVRTPAPHVAGPPDSGQCRDGGVPREIRIGSDVTSRWAILITEHLFPNSDANYAVVSTIAEVCRKPNDASHGSRRAMPVGSRSSFLGIMLR